jgi:quinol monooxygenase YgiN
MTSTWRAERSITMIKHVVFMKFKAGVTDKDIAEIEKGLRGLPGRIPEIKEYQFGRDIVRSERSYDFALISAFEDLEALKRYQANQHHLPVVAKVKELSENILAVDFTF